MLLLLAVAVWAFGWCLPWPDPAAAGYVLERLAWCAVLWIVLQRSGIVGRCIAAGGIAIGLLGATCAAWWPVLSQVDGVCDEATGRPVTAAVAAVALAVLTAWLTGTRDGGGKG